MASGSIAEILRLCYNAENEGGTGMRKKLPFHAVHLRLFALVFMLLDHLWATIVPGNLWMTCVGRLAFPIFAFQAAEGYEHTSDFRRYTRRLLVGALLSEIPLNLMVADSVFYPFHQNVLFTLLLGLYGIRAVDRARQGGSWPKALAVVLLVTAAGACTFVDYGAVGVLTVLAFGVLRRVRGERLWQLAAMLLLHVVCMEGQVLILGPVELPLQSFAVLSLGFIWLYSGEKGPRSRTLQYGCYLFYPVHMLVLCALSRFG